MNARVPNEPVPTEGLEVVRYEPVEDVPDCLPAITPPLSPTEQTEAEQAGVRGVMGADTKTVDVLAVRYYVGHVQAQTEFAAVSTGQLTGLPVFKEVPSDPVLGGRFKYIDGGWDWVGPCPQRPIAVDHENLDAPVCVSECRYRQPFGGFDRQRNALRMELASLVQRERCGWNLLPGRIGGHPLDYAPCTALRAVSGEVSNG